MSLDRFSDEDVAAFRERFGNLGWRDFASMWEAYESADPSLGDPDVPHVFAVRFISQHINKVFAADPFDFYLALREAFFQAMTVVVEHREPGKRYFK